MAEAARRAWCDRQGLAPQEINALVLRQLKVRKFQIATWGADLNAYFLRRKPQLDRVIYSYLEAADPEIAQELYFRIVNGEQEFSDAAKQYAQGPEALTGGLVGPLELGQLHPALAALLRASTPGQLHLPVALDGKTIVVRLEQWFPARFDQATGDRLYQELLQAWLEQQRAALPVTSHFSPQPLDGPACSPNGCQG
ncbi:MAG: hypothetical protein HC890_13955 [Chloroflexaceae bacterium]|nr:hypothetical protein [Chloroflexaceae bacterium]